MTEERLKSIMDEVAIDEGYTNWEEMYQKPFIFSERVVKAMKRAVNETLEEAAEKAEVQIKPRHKPTVLRDKYIPTEDWAASVYKESILNLKVK